MLAALALVCGPALERTGEPAAAAAAALRTPAQPAASNAAAAEPATTWDGALAIRPSKFAKAPAAGVKDVALVQPAAPAGPPGEVGALGIPLMVLQAYHSAANHLGQDEPSCKLPWWLLAGIGHTESGHAESGRLTADGTTRGRILGPRLDGGIAGDAVIKDTDHGVLDGDTVYDRAVGPMQFIPSTWRTWGLDGNGDGKADPNNIFDATLAAGSYLCADGRDLSTEAGRKAAVLSYNYSPAYLATVLAWGEAYRDGASSVPDSPLPVVSDVTKVRPPRTARPPKPVAKPSASPSGPVSSSHPAPSGSASGSGSTSGSASGSSTASATASATPTCSTTSPAPTDSASSSVAVQSASGQSHTAPSGSTVGSATADGSATSPAASGAAATSRPQTATAQGSAGQSSAGQSDPQDSSSASSSAPPSCTP